VDRSGAAPTVPALRLDQSSGDLGLSVPAKSGGILGVIDDFVIFDNIDRYSMETIFTLRQEELDSEFLNTIKQLFRNSRELQITISTAEDFGLTRRESREEYVARLTKAAQNLATESGRVVMTEAEFDDFSSDILLK
jgi:hypothetical protein